MRLDASPLARACLLAVFGGALGCTAQVGGPGGSAAATTNPDARSQGEPGSRAQPGSHADAPEGSPSDWVARGEAALEDGQPARAAALFARTLGASGAGSDASSELGRAYLGLARAQEQLGDFEAAIRAYDGFIARFPDDAQLATVLARRGACEAELYQWERSAASFAQILTLGDQLLPSERVEALAREGLALFQLDRLDEADARFAEADAIYTEASESGTERFSDTYFVAMARFYRAAVVHVRFRRAPIRLPEAQMAKDFDAKLELLQEAQEAYNEVIRTRHVFWVSAAGYQLGTLFEEFYDAVMHAPVPDWLDESQRAVYYAELEEQLRPVVEKAVWVFEKNLETARKLGYESDFIAQTRDRLASLQAVMLGRDGGGAPVPRLAPTLAPETGAAEPTSALESLPGVERKLFVPMPTTL